MDRALLITYEPALFLLLALAWAGWEYWSMREKKGAQDRASPTDPPPSDPPAAP